MALQGQASTLKDFVLKSKAKYIEQLQLEVANLGDMHYLRFVFIFRAIMFDRGEVILWDHYGGEEWWRARLSLRFSKRLIAYAGRVLSQNQVQRSDPNSAAYKRNSYISVHLRRKDFLYGRKSRLPSISAVARQISTLSRNLNIPNVYLATDAEPQGK
jgi:peptide-O-fucosyltransferase